LAAIVTVAAGTTLAQPPLARSPHDCGPLQFVENGGQWPSRVAFQARRGPLAAWFHRHGWTMRLGRIDDRHATGVSVRLTFERSAKSAPRGERALPTTSSFFRGDPQRWVRGVQSFERIHYADLYPGIDVVVRSRGQSPEYDIHVARGAGLGQVVVRCEGVDGLRLDDDGSLLMDTAYGPIRQRRPETWLVRRDGTRQPAACAFRILDDERYGFAVEGLDDDLAVVVDPGFEWSTYYSGSADDRVFTVRPNGRGEVFVTGLTNSTDLPTTMGAYQEKNAGDWEAFVALFDPRKTGAAQLVSATYLGGSGLDEGYELRIDRTGRVVTVSGYTESKDFPTTWNALQPKFAGGLSDGFYAKLDFHGKGSRLIYSTYVGGPKDDWVNGHVEDDNGVTTIAGQTQDGFPVTKGAFQTEYGGGDFDIYVMQLETRRHPMTQRRWSTYLGGNGADGDRIDFTDRGLYVGLDGHGGALLSGRTASTDFPTSKGAYQTALSGTTDAFVARLSPDGRRLVYSTYFGGTGDEDFNEVVWDGCGGNVSAGGYTTAGIPTTTDAYQKNYVGGVSDIILVRLDTWKQGNAQLVYATHVGGKDGPATSTERIRAFKTERSGAFLFGGWTGSTDFPTTPGAFRTTFGSPPIEAILGRLDPQQPPADQLLYATFIPGNSGEAMINLSQDAVGGVFCGGVTTSTDFVTTPGAFQSVGAPRDGWVAQFDLLPDGVTKLGSSTPAHDGNIYAGVTTQPRKGKPVIGLFNNNAPPRRFGLLLLGSPAKTPKRVFGVEVWVDLNKPLEAIPVFSNSKGYAQVNMKQTELPASPAAFQFLWFWPASASNALTF